MHKIAITAVAALASMTIAAAAQMPTTPRHTATPSAGQAPAPKPAVNPLTQNVVSDIEGTAVYGNDKDKDKIGHVSEVLMDPQSKKIDRLVVNAGGVLGIGGHRVAIPIDQFKWDSQKGGFLLGMTEAKLKSMPEWKEGANTMTGSSQPTTPTPSNAAGGSEK